jgi:hypothetical protein
VHWEIHIGFCDKLPMYLESMLGKMAKDPGGQLITDPPDTGIYILDFL